MKQAFRRALPWLALALTASPALADTSHQLELAPGGVTYQIALDRLWSTSPANTSVLQAPGFGTWSSGVYTPGAYFEEAGIDRLTLVDTTTGERMTLVLVAAEDMSNEFNIDTFSGVGLGEGWADEDGSGPGQVFIGHGVAEIYGEGGVSNAIILEPNDPVAGQPRQLGAGGGSTGIPPFGQGPVESYNRTTFIDLTELARLEWRHKDSTLQIRGVAYAENSNCEDPVCSTPWRTIDLTLDLDFDLTVSQDIVHGTDGIDNIGTFPELTMRVKVTNINTGAVLIHDEYHGIEASLPNESVARIGILDPDPEFVQAISLNFVRHTLAYTPEGQSTESHFEDLQGGDTGANWDQEDGVDLWDSSGEWFGRTTMASISLPSEEVSARIFHAETSGAAASRKKARIAFDLDLSAAYLVDNESMLVAAGIGDTYNDLDTTTPFQILIQKLSGNHRIWARTFNSGGATAYKTNVHTFSPSNPLRVVLRWQAPPSGGEGVMKLWVDGTRYLWQTAGGPTTLYKLCKGVSFGPSNLSLLSTMQPSPSNGHKIVGIDRLTYVVVKDPPPQEQ